MNSKAREALKKANRTLCRWREDLPVSAWEEVDTTILKIQAALAVEWMEELKPTKEREVK